MGWVMPSSWLNRNTLTHGMVICFAAEVPGSDLRKHTKRRDALVTWHDHMTVLDARNLDFRRLKTML